MIPPKPSSVSQKGTFSDGFAIKKLPRRRVSGQHATQSRQRIKAIVIANCNDLAFVYKGLTI